jgi:ketosteroid isomerase-like protein
VSADPVSVAVLFNNSINAADLAGLAALMSDDHVFVDTEGACVSGKEACLAAWQGFFESFPDYRNVFSSLTARESMVTIVGHSVCSEPSLDGPALWTATVRENKITQWRVYADTPQTRDELAIPRP